MGEYLCKSSCLEKEVWAQCLKTMATWLYLHQDNHYQERTNTTEEAGSPRSMGLAMGEILMPFNLSFRLRYELRFLKKNKQDLEKNLRKISRASKISFIQSFKRIENCENKEEILYQNKRH